MTTIIQQNNNCEVYNGTFTGCLFTMKPSRKKVKKQKRIENIEDAKYEEL